MVDSRTDTIRSWVGYGYKSFGKSSLNDLRRQINDSVDAMGGDMPDFWILDKFMANAVAKEIGYGSDWDEAVAQTKMITTGLEIHGVLVRSGVGIIVSPNKKTGPMAFGTQQTKVETDEYRARNPPPEGWPFL